ncbi:MAG: hypothetical protein AAFU64_10555 [Bacteroidota bacterium]
MSKKIIYVDMDDVLCNFSQALREQYTFSQPRPHQSKTGFFQNLSLMPQALDSFHFLSQQEIFEVYILTAPSIRNPQSYTEKRLWVEEHLGFEMVNRLIISPNKGLSKGDYLIDDHINGRGQEGFEGKLIHFGSADFPDWLAVMDYFHQKYEI